MGKPKTIFHRTAKIFVVANIIETFAESFVFAKNKSGHNFMIRRLKMVIRGTANFITILVLQKFTKMEDCILVLEVL
jgi:hypothetical protein